MTKQTEILRGKLVEDLKFRNVTAWAVFNNDTPNPYPIGRRAVWVFAKQGKATDSHKWKLFEHFSNKP